MAGDALFVDNLSMWHNLTTWTIQQLRSTVNVTNYALSFEDLVLAGPRMVMKLGSFIPFPDAIDGIGHHAIPEPTIPGMLHSALVATESVPVDIMEQPIGVDDGGNLSGSLSMESAKGLGSVFSYATSKWALCCIVMAILLNRTHIFAATRRRLRLHWHSRLLLRIMPVCLLLFQAVRLLRSIQCQTSPDFSELRWHNASKSSDLMFSQSNTLLHTLSSTLLLGSSDKASCLAVGMIPSNDQVLAHEIKGSLSLLWPLFGTFCLSQFVETVSCAVQGRLVAAETGMTLFEHSLAFAEADAAISNQLGWGLFGKSPPAESAASALGTSIALSRAMILGRVNTPAEVLLVAFFSTMNHITSHVLGILDLQSRYRLANTGFWGLCFMASILWSAATFSLDDSSAQGLLRFPTVCIVGFVPHVLVLGGIIACLTIYGLALLLSALAPPQASNADPRPIRERLIHAHHNMQANVSLSEIRITREMDFYTALLRTGFGVITMASEAVYLNEDRGVSLKRYTWLEEERLQEVEDIRMQWIGSGLADYRYDHIGTIGMVPIQSGPSDLSSGYSRERAAQQIPKARLGERRMRDGVGAAERGGRWLMALEFLMNINRLLVKAAAMGILKALSAMGIRRQPGWLVWLARRPKVAKESRKPSKSSSSRRANDVTRPFENAISIPRRDGVDVEAEFRRRIVAADEEELDSSLYRWWLKGGWWGVEDNSGDYLPGTLEADWDTTSVLSASEAGSSDADWEEEGDDADEGQRTPTQAFSGGSLPQMPFIDSPLRVADLARLLNPSSPEEREEAANLAAHLQCDRIMTRAQYLRMQRLQRTEVLQTGTQRVAETSHLMASKMSDVEEARILEQILLSRRASTAPLGDMGAATWENGASGMGPEGPQCVVCQSTPRTIIVWPCRCLSLCDDCRVSLAMNNFDKCVCCRREVVSFSRIFVP